MAPPLNVNSSTGSNSKPSLADQGNNYRSSPKQVSVSSGTDSRDYVPPPSSFSNPKQYAPSEKALSGLADFFSPEVFQIVLHNPTTAHRMLKFSQARMCGENMEFLEKVDRYSALLDELTTVMTEIHNSFTSNEAPKQLGINVKVLRPINGRIKECTVSTLPSMESIFSDAQVEVETLLRTAVYPRFVKYQMTNSASKALSTDRGKYQGLGDCFCMTDPNKADNPIVFASDGFVAVTGYSRTEVVPRNCRFLQGTHTDRTATKRLRTSIENREETVELLLNYKKNGEPFWNLLYVAPLYDANGKLVFFIGGQINCSTTIRSNTDVLRILSLSDDATDDKESAVDVQAQKPTKKSFFGFSRKDNTAQLPQSTKRVEVREAGMEPALLRQIEKMNFRSQMEHFYTAYSKYIVVKYDTYNIQHYSQGVVELLGITNRSGQDFSGNNIFKFLAQYTTTLPREFKSKVQYALRSGLSISASINLFTLNSLARRGDDKFFTHWTPTKDENVKPLLSLEDELQSLQIHYPNNCMAEPEQSKVSKEKFAPKDAPKLNPPIHDPISINDLSQYDGTHDGHPTYVAIMGTVFDVTGNKTYAPGAAYHVFAGKDASRALAKTSLKQEDCSPIWEDLDDKEKGVLNDWYTFFSKRYNIVGKVDKDPTQRN